MDSSKFKVVNVESNNFTFNKLDDRIKRLDEHISLYMEELLHLTEKESASCLKMIST